jgi:4-diphosphocytidyl-2-C-methyl-D-erythritol kinase
VDELSAPAPAKINLTLEILGKRSDGYHELRSVMQTLELADLVTVRSGGAPGISVDGPSAAGVPADESNLAWKAAEELARRTGHSTDHIRIAITKRIPAAGGLGGGASDAATTLRLLQRLWAIESEAAILDSANAVGSDEAFFLSGGTAMVSGRGDVVQTQPDIGARGVVLFLPHETIDAKTASLFRAYAGQPFDDGSQLTALLQRGEEPVSVSHTSNAFERVAFGVFRGLAGLRDEIEAVAGINVRLAGAGPALFWIGDDNRATEIASACSAIDCEVIETATMGSLWRR